MTEMLPPTLEALAAAEPDQAAIDAAWKRVQLARHPQRPRTLDLINRIFDGFVERFVIASWAEYVRLRARLTYGDQEVQDRVMRLQRPGVPLRISRLIGVSLEDVTASPGMMDET